MPVDLPIRKGFDLDVGFPMFGEWGLLLAGLCIVVALAGLITHTPQSYRAGLSAAVYEDMMLGL